MGQDSTLLLAGPCQVLVEEARQITGSGGTGTFVVGEIIWAPGGGAIGSATKLAIITAVGGTGANPILTYYLIGPMVDFINTDSIKGNTSAATCTSNAPIAADLDIGYTKGGVKVNVETKTFDIMADQNGSTPVNKVISGGPCTIDIPLAQFDLMNLRRSCSVAVPIQDDANPTDITKRRLEIRDLAGKSLLSIARKWTIKAIDPATGVASTDPRLWVTAPKAAPDAGTLSLDFMTEQQRVIAVKLYCFPDTVANKQRRLYFGDGTLTDANESGFLA